jgi:hypothetical protein
MKDFENKFTTKIGNDRVISSDKFNTYMNTAGKATSTTDRQKMLGNFVDAMDKHFSTVDELYKAAGIENPYPPISMASLKDSLEKKSVGAKLADIWHDKLGAPSLGSTAGAAVGSAVGHAFGQGLGGAYLGKEVLGPVFSNLIKPLLDKYPNVDVGAFNQAMAYGKSVLKGEKLLTNAVGSLFEGTGKTFPSHVLPSKDELDKLDKRLEKLNGNLQAQMGTPGKLGVYKDGHNTALASTVGTAAAYLNQQRPVSSRSLPFDSKTTVSSADKAQYQRTLEIAQQPLAILKHIKDGDLIPSDVATLKTIYPDYYQRIVEAAQQHAIDQIHEGKSVPYHTRQSLSLLMGYPMDSTMQPNAIMAAQRALTPQPPAQPQGKPKKPSEKASGALNKGSKAYQTSTQAAESDRAGRD